MIKKSKILIVDDEPRMCASLKTLLDAQDYEIQTCCSGNEALTYLNKDEFDLAILDVFMEGMDGFQVIEEIMKQKIDIPVIIMTGTASTESAVKALRMGACNYLKKPFESEELFLSVTNALSQRMLKKEKQLLSKKLKESEKKYRHLFKNAPAGIYEIDFEKVKFINVNEVMCKYSGYSEEEFLSMNPLDLLTEDSKNLFIERLEKLSKEKNMTRNVEYNIIKKNGQIICVILNSDFIYEKDKLIGARVVAHDISELKQAQIGREKLIKALQEAFESIKILTGLLPICSHCKKIRDDKGYWNQIEGYIQKHSDAEFSHGICPECAEKYYPDMDLYREDEN